MSHEDTMRMLTRRVPDVLHAPRAAMCSDMFRNLVYWPWWVTGLIIVGVLGTITCVFAAVYDALGPYACPTDDNATAVTSFVDLMMYSVSVTTTLLQSRCMPVSSNVAMLVANFHAWLVVLITVFLTGVVFTRMAAPGMQASISRFMLFNHHDPTCGRVLATRFFFNNKKHSLIDARFHVTFSRRVRSDFVKTDVLELVREEAPLLIIGTSIMHKINEDSPLAGETIQSLVEKGAWFLCTVQGTEATTMQTVFFSRVYRLRDDGTVVGKTVLDGEKWKFHPLSEERGDKYFLNFKRLNELVPLAGDGGGDGTSTGTGTGTHDNTGNAGDSARGRTGQTGEGGVTVTTEGLELDSDLNEPLSVNGSGSGSGSGPYIRR